MLRITVGIFALWGIWGLVEPLTGKFKFVRFYSFSVAIGPVPFLALPFDPS